MIFRAALAYQLIYDLIMEHKYKMSEILLYLYDLVEERV